MRGPRLAIALWVFLAASAGCSGCKPPEDKAGSCKGSGASCAVETDCCSGICGPGNTCVSCLGPGDTCADASQCCASAPLCNGTCVTAGSGCKAVSDPCSDPSDCCLNRCEGGICIDPNACKGLGVSCAADSDCCNGHCDTTTTHQCQTPPPPPPGTCGEKNDPCTSNGDCCVSCNTAAGKCVTDVFCGGNGSACTKGRDCCSGTCTPGSPTGTCSSTLCKVTGDTCASASQCCTGICSSGQCQPVSGATCKTLYDSCTLPADCCSTNCAGGRCAPAYTCNAPNDICWQGLDCCSGLCTVSAGSQVPGRCQKPTGSGCGQDGAPCSGPSNCCTRKCIDMGSGATVCKPAGGCRMTGEYCDATQDCCGGTDPNDTAAISPYGVYCDVAVGKHDYTPYWDTSNTDNLVCSGGQGCNPPGNICGGSGDDHVPASQNCCNSFGSGKDVCKPDEGGIMRCYGISGPNCPTGYHWDNPLCCIPQGDVCHFRDECCGYVPCTAGQDNVLRCLEPSGSCVPIGYRCSDTSAPSPDPCCTGTSCQYMGTEIGWFCSDSTPPPGCTKVLNQACSVNGDCCVGTCQGPAGNKTCQTTCTANAGTCTTNGACCSGFCDTTGHCAVPCIVENGSGCTVDADCCSGLTCEVPSGATSGTCKGSVGPPCAGDGQACVNTSDCCDTSQICSEGACRTPVSCPDVSQSCSTTNPCCSGLRCHTTLPQTNDYPYTCDPSSTGCFCEACAAENEGCSTTLPCCFAANSYCAKPGTLAACSPSDTNCFCKSVSQ